MTSKRTGHDDRTNVPSANLLGKYMPIAGCTCWLPTKVACFPQKNRMGPHLAARCAHCCHLPPVHLVLFDRGQLQPHPFFCARTPPTSTVLAATPDCNVDSANTEVCRPRQAPRYRRRRRCFFVGWFFGGPRRTVKVVCSRWASAWRLGGGPRGMTAPAAIVAVGVLASMGVVQC